MPKSSRSPTVMAQFSMRSSPLTIDTLAKGTIMSFMAKPGAGRNWWMVGYNAAMKAEKPADFNEWIAKSGDGCDTKAFLAGWHSVWKCERKHELEE